MGTTGLPVARDPHDGCRGREVAAVRGHGAAVGSGLQGGDKEGGEVLGSKAAVEGGADGEVDRGGKGRTRLRRRAQGKCGDGEAAMAQLRRGQGNVDDRAGRGRSRR